MQEKAKQRSAAMQEFHKVEDILRVFFDGKDPSNECKDGTLIDRSERKLNLSKSRTVSPERRLNVNNEVCRRASRLDTLPFQQPVVHQWTVQTSSLLKLKMTDFAADPLEWSEMPV